jgi:hypothetical protein
MQDGKGETLAHKMIIKNIVKADRIEVEVARQDSFELRYNRDIVVEEGTSELSI